jgi:1,2-diacylglycerol 3-alpha-glucosyltransferase
VKIAFISMFQEESGGGNGRVAHELAEQFAAEHEVVLLCPADKTGVSLGANGLQVFGLRSVGDDNFSLPALSARDVNRIFDFLDRFQPDVVHAHDPASIGLIGQIWAHLHGVPFVHTAHVLPSHFLDFGARDAVAILRGSITETIVKRFLTDFYLNCDALIALNATAADDIRRFGYAGRIFTIPNGRDLRKYNQSGPADMSLPGRTLTFVGHVSRRKNQLFLVEVMRYLPRSYRLLIVGELIEPMYFRKLEEHVRSNGLDNVVFLGKVKHADIPTYLANSHAFVSASRMEVQSLVLIEALASGTPVIGLANETVDELVDTRVGSRLPQTAEPREFAACVESICTLPQPAYDALCLNARERVKELDWSNVVRLTVEAYRALQQERPVTTRRQGVFLADLVSLLPPGEVRNALAEKVSLLNQKFQRRMSGRSQPDWLRQVRGAKRVSTRTWLLAGITVALSPIGYIFIKSTTVRTRLRRPGRTQKEAVE